MIVTTSGSVHVQTFNDNLEDLHVIESKRNAIRKGLVYEMLNAQDTVLCWYFAQRSGERSECQKSSLCSYEGVCVEARQARRGGKDQDV